MSPASTNTVLNVLSCCAWPLIHGRLHYLTPPRRLLLCRAEAWHNPTEFVLRQIQTYDFEADHPVSKAVYDFLGFLPVLPGPCGLYRYADLRKGRYRKYFEVVNKPSEECGLWLANLKIAEDRIPSLFAVFFSASMASDRHAAVTTQPQAFTTATGVSFTPGYDQETREKRTALLQKQLGVFKTHVRRTVTTVTGVSQPIQRIANAVRSGSCFLSFLAICQ